MLQVKRRVTANSSERIRQNERKFLFVPSTQVCEVLFYTQPMKMEQCSETSAHEIQTPGNHPKERIRHSEQGESLKLRMNENYYEYNCNWKCLYLLFSSLLFKKLKIKIYRTIILPVVLYGCETWSLTLSEERRLRVFENRVLRREFGPKREEVTGEWRKLHNEELSDL